MKKPARLLSDLFRLLLLIILLPLILLLIGPILVLASLLGRISFGKLKLEPGKHSSQGRGWALIIGLLLWGLVWGGILWLASDWLVQQPAIANAPAPTQTVPALPTATSASSANPIVEATETPLPAFEPAPQLQPSPTATLAPLDAPTNTPVPTLAFTPTPEPSPTSAPSATATLVVPKPSAPLAPVEDAEILETLVQGNNVLVRALESPGPITLAVLDTVWQQNGLQQVQDFVTRVTQSYPENLSASYVTLGQPNITILDDEQAITVQTREFWTFETGIEKREVLNVYTYTLQMADDKLKIVDYEFKALPLSTLSGAGE